MHVPILCRLCCISIRVASRRCRRRRRRRRRRPHHYQQPTSGRLSAAQSQSGNACQSSLPCPHTRLRSGFTSSLRKAPSLLSCPSSRCLPLPHHLQLYFTPPSPTQPPDTSISQRRAKSKKKMEQMFIRKRSSRLQDRDPHIDFRYEPPAPRKSSSSRSKSVDSVSSFDERLPVELPDEVGLTREERFKRRELNIPASFEPVRSRKQNSESLFASSYQDQELQSQQSKNESVDDWYISSHFQPLQNKIYSHISLPR